MKGSSPSGYICIARSPYARKMWPILLIYASIIRVRYISITHVRACTRSNINIEIIYLLLRTSFLIMLTQLRKKHNLSSLESVLFGDWIFENGKGGRILKCFIFSGVRCSRYSCIPTSEKISPLSSGNESSVISRKLVTLSSVSLLEVISVLR